MKQHTSEAFSTAAVGRTLLMLTRIVMPPRDPDEDEEETVTAPKLRRRCSRALSTI